MNDPRFTDAALDRLRSVGDDEADALADRLLATGGAGGADETDVLARAVRAAVAGPASDDDAVVAWMRDAPPLPAWADDERVARGQRFFRSWPLPIATTLFCASLPTAYAAPHGAEVLAATSQLGERERVARRLAGTGRMLFDVMGCDGEATAGLHPGTQGYVSTRGVRLLHALVRRALLTSTARPWPVAEHGVPVNQEDLLGTLCTFTVTVLDGLEALGVPVAPEDAEGYAHAWCVAGAVLGIDETLVDLTLDELRALAATIARRQLGPSPAGTRLARLLLDEMRLAMPPGADGLPGALVHRLVPDVARLLEVPPPSPRWRAALDLSAGVGRGWPGGFGLHELTAGPAALVGRSVLRMLVDREEQPGGPSYRLPVAALRRVTGGGGRRRADARTERRRARGDAVGVGTHVGPTGRAARAALAHPVELPVDADDVRLVASEGFPLWEPVEAMALRNRRITVAYADLSRQLADLVAGDGGVRDANWATFATWSSRTIGTFIDGIPRPGERADDRLDDPPGAGDEGPAGRSGALPGAAGTGREGVWGGPRARRLTRRLMTREDGASFRALAAGNRVVFLEVGLALALFLQHFPDRVAAAGEGGDKAWDDCWDAIRRALEEDVALLDPSWMLTPTPPPDDFRLGLRQYFAALREDDQRLRSQRVLAGNLLIGAYEQRRVEGYVWAALALWPESAMRRLIRDRTGAIAGPRAWPSRAFARAMTRRMTVLLCDDEPVRVGRPVPPPPDPSDAWDELATDAGVTLPVLQALVTRYELAVGARPGRGSRNWTSFDERMVAIGGLFRARQRQAGLFAAPFGPEETAALLAGRPDGGDDGS